MSRSSTKPSGSGLPAEPADEQSGGLAEEDDRGQAPASDRRSARLLTALRIPRPTLTIRFGNRGGKA